MLKNLPLRRWVTAIAVLAAGCAPNLFGPPKPAGVPTLMTAPAGPSMAPDATSGATLMPEAFALDLTPLPTPTALPTLELPTLPGNPQDMQLWDGLPTYPAESRSEFYFRVRYDPAQWALTRDQFGRIALINRNLQGCVLATAGGRGLPLGGTVDHEVREIGRINYEISRLSVSGTAQLVTYAGGNGVIYTAFELSLGDQSDACAATAELVLGTLSSVPLAEATAVSP